MRNKIIASMLAAASFSFATSVFASGYGPAPFYHSAAGSTSSAPVQNTAAGYGGVADGMSSSGSHHPLLAINHSIHSLERTILSSVRPDPNDGMKSIYFGH